MKPSDIPNIITVFRFLLVPPVVVLLLQDRFFAALVVFGIAGISDGLDGFLAKHYHWTSRIGALMDPLADKLLMVSSYLTLGWLGLIPQWLVALAILGALVAALFVLPALIFAFEQGAEWGMKDPPRRQSGADASGHFRTI